MYEVVTLVASKDTGHVKGISKSTTGYIKITWWDGIDQIFGTGNLEVKINWSRAAASGKQTFTIISCDETGSASGNLTALDCSNNKLISLDVSTCTALYFLNCNSNSLKVLDMSHLFALRYLYCSNNYLQILDVSGCTALTQLGCIGNSLSSLDASGFISVPYVNGNLDDLTAMPVTQRIANNETLCVSNYGLDIANVLSKQGGGYFQKILGVQLEHRHMCTVLPALQLATHAFSNNALRSSLI